MLLHVDTTASNNNDTERKIASQYLPLTNAG